jgi:hypothetical protein
LRVGTDAAVVDYSEGSCRKEDDMSTISHPPTRVSSDTRTWTRVVIAETWASLAIVAMWMAVAVSAVWGPDFVSSSRSGTNTTTIPSGIVIGMFATIGTWFVAKYGLVRRTD